MVLRSAVCLLALLFLHSAALAEKRMALLIGNEGYASEIGRLSNPHNDVALLERNLKVLSFEVITVRDVGLGALTRAVNAYARRVQAAGPNAVGFFYYSGHGASDGSTNYLIPVDVKTTETGELWDQSLRLTEITRKLKTEAGNATHFVVFDACRNTLKLTQPGSRAIVQSKGFVPLTQENGMLIAYATAEGELASDVGAVVMFRAVQRRVRVAIHQEPYLSFSDLGDVYFAGKGEPVAEVRANYEMADDLLVRLQQGREILRAATYIATEADRTLQPYDWYRALVIAGALQHTLPDQWIAMLNQVASVPDPDPKRRSSAIAVLKKAGFGHLLKQ